MENTMYAGFHCVEVQPPLGLLIPGYYRRRPAEGTADPLHLRAVAFASGDEKAVFFNCEAIGMRANAYDIIKKKIAAACDISEQISLAGKEASGTGNMKLMMNGALTIGTLDGANVEIHESVGDDNMFLFGMKTEEVNSLRSRGYDPMSFYNNNEDIRKILDFISRGINGQNFSDISGTIFDFYSLKGIIVDRFQCSNLVGMLGVKIKE